MTSIVTLAVILVLFRILSDAFIFSVILKQIALLRMPVPSYLKSFRLVLFFLSLAIFLGNMIPIVIDLLTIFIETGRPAQLRPISVMYAISGATTALLSAFLIWLLYRLADNDHDITEYTEQCLPDQMHKLHAKKAAKKSL